uniref:Ovule protein n=1 Tax=Ascaris lumbricoides TaxID=6252 RepID=A0A0M3IN55_ASCLU
LQLWLLCKNLTIFYTQLYLLLEINNNVLNELANYEVNITGRINVKLCTRLHFAIPQGKAFYNLCFWH